MTLEQELIIREICINILATPELIELFGNKLDIPDKVLENACRLYAKETATDDTFPRPWSEMGELLPKEE